MTQVIRTITPGDQAKRDITTNGLLRRITRTVITEGYAEKINVPIGNGAMGIRTGDS